VYAVSCSTCRKSRRVGQPPSWRFCCRCKGGTTRCSLTFRGAGRTPCSGRGKEGVQGSFDYATTSLREVFTALRMTELEEKSEGESPREWLRGIPPLRNGRATMGHPLSCWCAENTRSFDYAETSLREVSASLRMTILERRKPTGTAFVVSHLCATDAQRWGALGLAGARKRRRARSPRRSRLGGRWSGGDICRG